MGVHNQNKHGKMRYLVKNHRAATGADFEEGKILFKPYVDSLGIDLSFQDFETELMIIDKQYSKPEGGLLLARIDKSYVGCSGVRKLDDQTAEIGLRETADHRSKKLSLPGI
jgi:hypothetical protein